MIELGKKQVLTIKRVKTFGVYLGCEGEEQAVLLRPNMCRKAARSVMRSKYLFIVILRTDWWQQHWSQS